MKHRSWDRFNPNILNTEVKWGEVVDGYTRWKNYEKILKNYWNGACRCTATSRVRKTVWWWEVVQRWYLLHKLGLEQETFYWFLHLCNIFLCVSKFKIQTRPIGLLRNTGSVNAGQCLPKQSAFINYEVHFSNCYFSFASFTSENNKLQSIMDIPDFEEIPFSY